MPMSHAHISHANGTRHVTDMAVLSCNCRMATAGLGIDMNTHPTRCNNYNTIIVIVEAVSGVVDHRVSSVCERVRGRTYSCETKRKAEGEINEPGASRCG